MIFPDVPINRVKTTEMMLETTEPSQPEITDGRYGLGTMCIGVGQGIAMSIERAN